MSLEFSFIEQVGIYHFCAVELLILHLAILFCGLTYFLFHRDVWPSSLIFVCNSFNFLAVICIRTFYKHYITGTNVFISHSSATLHWTAERYGWSYIMNICCRPKSEGIRAFLWLSGFPKFSAETWLSAASTQHFRMFLIVFKTAL